MPLFNMGNDFACVKIQCGQNRQSSMANIFMVTSNAGMFIRYGRKIGSGCTKCLYSRFFIHADAVNRYRTRIMHHTSTVQTHVAIDCQYFDHFTFELLITPFQVIPHPVRLKIVSIKDAPYSGLACLRQPRKTGCHSMR